MKLAPIFAATLLISFMTISCGKQTKTEEVSQYENITVDLYPYLCDNGKYGYIDDSGDTKIDGKYDSAKDFSEGLAAVRMGDRWGYIDQDGDFAIALGYDSAEPFDGWRAKVQKNSLYGYIDHNNNQVIACQFDEIGDWTDGKAYAWQNGKVGIIDDAGAQLLRCAYDEIKPFNDNLLLLYNDNNYGFASSDDLEELLPCNYSWPESRCDTADVVYYSLIEKIGDDRKFGLMDEQGHIVVEPKYDAAFEIDEGNLMRVMLGDKIGYVNLNGQEVIPVEFEGSDKVGNRYILHHNENGYSLADNRTGDILTKEAYDLLEPYNDNLILAKNNGLYGLIDFDGNEALKCDYDQLRSEYDVIHLWKETPAGGRAGLANRSTGKLLVECDKYTKIESFDRYNGEYAIVYTRSHVFPIGLINKHGKEVLPCKYMYIYRVENGKAEARAQEDGVNSKWIPLNE